MIPSHKLAEWLVRTIDRGLDAIGLDKNPQIEEVVYFIIIVAVALLIGKAIRWVLYHGVRRWVQVRHTTWGEELLAARTLQRGSHIVPPLVLMACLPIAFDTASTGHTIMMRAVGAYALLALGVAISAILDFIWLRFNRHENEKRLPLKGMLNVAKGVEWGIILILAVAVCIGRSPAVLLGGLGAFAAALMLVFKDSILGFVAGVQLSENDMLHVGDWITVPSTPADGVVLDVTLSAVTVQNFDNTLVYLPPYTLVSTSFQNWRGMSESGMRRIARNILIDADTVVNDPKNPQVSNLTEYRAWCLDYLNHHPRITTAGTNGLTMVRLMEQTPAGIPLQLYCFVNTTVWPDYEGVQSEIQEHITSGAAQFGLKISNLSLQSA